MGKFLYAGRLYNHSVNSANKSRDGRTKDILFGGTWRDRQSSQANKREVRQRFFSDKRCLNSPYHNISIGRKLLSDNKDMTDAIDLTEWLFNILDLPAYPDQSVVSEEVEREQEERDDSKATNGEEVEEEEEESGKVSFRLSPEEVAWLMAQAIKLYATFKKDKDFPKKRTANPEIRKSLRKELQKAFLDVYAKHRQSEIALFGRFLAANRDINVDAAVFMGHAIGINQSIEQSDDLTAVDELSAQTSGAAHMNSDHFLSSCFFQEMTVDLNLYLSNLAGDTKSFSEDLDRLLQGFSLCQPMGKQHGMFSLPLPSLVHFEVFETQFSLSNAYLSPVRAGEQTKPLDCLGVERFVRYREMCLRNFGIQSISGPVQMVNVLDYPEKSEPLSEAIGKILGFCKVD